MSALPSAEVVRVERLEEGLPAWPPSELGWAPPVPRREVVRPGHRPMHHADLAGWTVEGLETLARVLRYAIHRNRGTR